MCWPGSSTNLVHLLLQVFHLPLSALDDPLDIIDAGPKVGQLTLQLGLLLQEMGLRALKETRFLSGRS